jgi:hypothetical protein
MFLKQAKLLWQETQPTSKTMIKFGGYTLGLNLSNWRNAKLARGLRLMLVLVFTFDHGLMIFSKKIQSASFDKTTISSSQKAVLKLRTNRCSYRVGQRIVVEVTLLKNGFLYLFNVRADGLIDLLVPNRFADGDSRSWAGERRRFPEIDSGWWFVTPEPIGKHYLLALLLPNGLKLEGLARFEAGNPFAVVIPKGLVALQAALKKRLDQTVARANLMYLVVK